MAELDLLTKFNRGLILSLVEKDMYQAVQTYREYTSYLHSNDKIDSYKEELIKIRYAFLTKLANYVQSSSNKNKFESLIPAYQELIAAFPSDPKILTGAASCFDGLEQFDIALELLKKASTFAPVDLEIKKSLIEECQKTGNFEEAKEMAKFVAEKEPFVANNFCVLGICSDKIYEQTNNEQELKNAILNMEIARKMSPGEKLFLKNLIVLYSKAHDEEKLKSAWGEYLKFPNFNNEDYFDYSAYLLRHGDFKKGFELYEKRFFHETKPIKYPKINKPKYDGKKDISKSTLLVQFEQGFGDVFLFSRFLKCLESRAGKIIVRMPKRVIEILKRSFPFVEAVPEEDVPIEDIKFDYHLPMMSMPYVLNLEKDNIPYREKYLFADEKKVEFFKKELFNNDKFKIGIAYKGSYKGMNSRNVPLKELLPLAEIEGVAVYSLQFEEAQNTYEGTKIINAAEYIKTFDDTAALIENTDLIVTSDNSVMNLAGALGKRTFCLFNDLAEFRWFDLTGDDVKWFKTVKPFSCKKQNAWAPVVQAVIEDIKKII